MILLAYLGAKVPSSFILEKESFFNFDGNSLKKFRFELGLSMREFSALFDISLSSITKIENGQAKGKEVLKRIELYQKFPEAAVYEISRNKRMVHSDCYRAVMIKINEKL